MIKGRNHLTLGITEFRIVRNLEIKIRNPQIYNRGDREKIVLIILYGKRSGRKQKEKVKFYKYAELKDKSLTTG